MRIVGIYRPERACAKGAGNTRFSSAHFPRAHARLRKRAATHWPRGEHNVWSFATARAIEIEPLVSLDTPTTLLRQVMSVAVI